MIETGELIGNNGITLDSLVVDLNTYNELIETRTKYELLRHLMIDNKTFYGIDANVISALLNLRDVEVVGHE